MSQKFKAAKKVLKKARVDVKLQRPPKPSKPAVGGGDDLEENLSYEAPEEDGEAVEAEEVGAVAVVGEDEDEGEDVQAAVPSSAQPDTVVDPEAAAARLLKKKRRFEALKVLFYCYLDFV
jgi:hypothetical protein